MMKQERLQKVIADSGHCSRRAAELLIKEGRVQVNGQIVEQMGVKVNENDQILIDGDLLTKGNEKIYLVLNKPNKCVTTVFDPQGRKCVMDYVSSIKTRIYPIGRLDYDTSGLLIFTNDGDFAHGIMHPKHLITKTYYAQVKGKINDQLIAQLKEGVIIDGDFKTSPSKVEVKNIDQQKKQYELYLTIHEGHNQQVKKMISAIGGHVLKLERVAIAFLQSKNLKLGRYRFLTEQEVEAFKKLFAG